MSYALVKAALMDVLGDVTGIAAAANVGYLPKQVSTSRALFTVLDRAERARHGQVTAMRYFITASLVVQYIDNAAAEAEIDNFINRIPLAVDAQPGLGIVGTGISSVYAQVTDIDADFLNVAGTRYRLVEFTVDVLEKGTGI